MTALLHRVFVILTACGTLAACGGDDALEAAPAVRPTTTPTDNVPPPPADSLRTLEGGVMTIRVSAAADRILDYAGVRLTTTGAADHGERELTFPITSGKLSVAPTEGRVNLAGALRISVRDDHVEATDLRLDLAQEVVTATIEGRPVPLLRFKLRYPASPPDAGPLIANGSVSAVGDRALERLGADFGVEIFREGLPLGTMRLTAW